MKTNCTILIPTFKRPECLERILEYYAGYGDHFKIIVGDSSPFQERKKNKEMARRFPGNEIKYLDNYSEKLNAFHKFADMVQKVKTKYCVFCADDDFVIPEGIIEALDFLEKNKDYALAHGHYIRFYLSKTNNNKKSKAHFAWAPRYSNSCSIAFPDAKSRLAFYMSHYSIPTLYAVHRASLLKKAYREFVKSGVDPRLFGEMLPSFLILIYGKMKKLDVLYAARDSSTIRDARRNADWPDLVDFIENGTYAKNYAKFRQCLAQNLSKTGKIKLKEAEKTVDDAIVLYVARSYSERKRKIGKLGKLFNALGLPKGMDEGIRRIYRKLSAKKQAKSDAFWQALDNPSSKAAKELAVIKECVLSHSEKADN